MRPDWEAVITPVVDFLVDRDDVDADRIALIGLSLGAHLAPRAASAEHRLAACVADCGSFDLYASFLARVPGPLAGPFDRGRRPAVAVMRRILARLAKDPTAGWALRRGMLVHGVDDAIGYVDALRAFTLEGRAGSIRCPTWLCSAEGDDISASARPACRGADLRARVRPLPEGRGRRRSLRGQRPRALSPRVLRLARGRLHPERAAPEVEPASSSRPTRIDVRTPGLRTRRLDLAPLTVDDAAEMVACSPTRRCTRSRGASRRTSQTLARPTGASSPGRRRPVGDVAQLDRPARRRWHGRSGRSRRRSGRATTGGGRVGHRRPVAGPRLRERGGRGARRVARAVGGTRSCSPSSTRTTPPRPRSRAARPRADGRARGRRARLAARRRGEGR